MHKHSPKDYKCPMCLIVEGHDNPDVYAKVSDIFYKDDLITAFIGGKWWERNPGGTIIIPNKHFENIYDIEEDYLISVARFSKKLAIALKEVYNCDGVSTRQHNEPAGNQDMWHFHYHVMPRYINDLLYENNQKARWTTAEDRKPYVMKLKEYFDK